MKIDSNHKKNDESMLNYYIAMDYKSKNKIKNYLHYLEKSAAAENIYPESALELAQHNKDNVETAISYYKLYAKNKPSQRTLAYNKIENILFDNQQYDDVEILYRELLEKSFDEYLIIYFFSLVAIAEAVAAPPIIGSEIESGRGLVFSM